MSRLELLGGGVDAILLRNKEQPTDDSRIERYTAALKFHCGSSKNAVERAFQACIGLELKKGYQILSKLKAHMP